MTIIEDMSSAFAMVGRRVTGKPFFMATYIIGLLWLTVLVSGARGGLAWIVTICTIAYLVECMNAVITARRKLNE